MPNWRMLPPVNQPNAPNAAALFNPCTVNGRSYSCAAGSFVDVPAQDAALLQANFWVKAARSGTTAQRPTGSDPDFNGNGQIGAGYPYLDTTLGKIVVADGGGGWRDPNTGALV